MNSDQAKTILLWIFYLLLLNVFVAAGMTAEYVTMLIMIAVIIVTYTIEKRRAHIR